ncbi:DMT family transporter [Algibacillus agarilyticus]|uniref:DMT family transporter n=1 Tax=Algibacillus agarilyticus TaxID=2234133 RepID=UPI0022B80E21|nr:DMT family transporter [Algibacillus agarilyticus]
MHLSAYFKNIFNFLPIGVWYMLLSAFGFALMAVCVKEVSTAGIPVLEIVAARAIVSIFLSYADIKRKKISLWGVNKPFLIARGVVGAFALMCVYYSITTLPLAEATILQYLNPVFTAILAYFFMKERIQLSTITCILLCLLGLFAIVLPNFNQDHIVHYPWFSIAMGILGAFGSGVAYILIKKLTKTDDSSVIVFYFPFIALPISVVLLGSDFVMPTLPILGLLILVGIFTQVGQLGLTKSMQSEVASKATAYSYVQVVFAIFLGWLFFAEVPTLSTLIGGGLIMAGAFINVFWKR